MPEQQKLRTEQIMSTDVPTLSRDASIADAVHLLAEQDVSCAVIVDERGHPDGIITERDLLVFARNEGGTRVARLLQRMLQEEHHIFDSMRELRKSAASEVGQVMNSPVRCAEPEMTISQVASIMETFDYKQLPVVREGRLIGLVTRQDIVRALADTS